MWMGLVAWIACCNKKEVCDQGNIVLWMVYGDIRDGYFVVGLVTADVLVLVQFLRQVCLRIRRCVGVPAVPFSSTVDVPRGAGFVFVVPAIVPTVPGVVAAVRTTVLGGAPSVVPTFFPCVPAVRAV
jgi:hypothetical protein